MTEILFSVSPSVFIWSMLGCGSSSAAFLLLRPEKGVVWPIARWAHSARVPVLALVMTDLVSISGNAATGRATWRHLSSSPSTGNKQRRKNKRMHSSVQHIHTIITIDRMWIYEIHLTWNNCTYGNGLLQCFSTSETVRSGTDEKTLWFEWHTRCGWESPKKY